MDSFNKLDDFLKNKFLKIIFKIFFRILLKNNGRKIKTWLDKLPHKDPTRSMQKNSQSTAIQPLSIIITKSTSIFNENSFTDDKNKTIIII
jgi:hypothetical protein